MAQKHLESDILFEIVFVSVFFTEGIFIVFAKVSRNMFFLHTCSKFMNNVG